MLLTRRAVPVSIPPSRPARMTRVHKHVRPAHRTYEYVLAVALTAMAGWGVYAFIEAFKLIIRTPFTAPWFFGGWL